MKMKLISASAGSGKTWSLTEELHQIIDRGDAAPEQVIAVTFTRAAASELKERVRTKLFERGNAEAAHRMESALVGTVHSVCERILKRFAFEAGISPDFQVMPEEEADAFFSESISSVLARQELGRYIEAMDRFGVYYNDRLSDVLTTATMARANRITPDSLRLMAQENIESYLAIIPGHVVPAGTNTSTLLVQELERVITAIENNIDTKVDTTKATAEYLQFIRGIFAKARSGKMSWKEMAELQHKRPGSKSAGLCDVPADLAARHLSDPLFREDISTCIHTVFSLAADALGAYDAWKKERGLIDFTDMEEKTHDLLENQYVSETIAREYRVLMVDEFQDTSPLQLALFNRLGMAAGRMIWVGDKKQCIYGFRDSDPALMDTAYEAMAQSAETDILGKSYRSRPPLVRFANAVFGKTFGALGHSSEEIKLTPERQENKDLPPSIEIWLTASKNAASDTAMIAHGIRTLLDAGNPVLIEDKLSGKPRPLRPGDIAVLRRNNNDCVAMAVELGNLGIRVGIARDELTATLEGIYLHAACEIVLDRRASLPVAVLRHLRSGGSAETLVDERMGHILAAKKAGDPDETPAGDPVLDGLTGIAERAKYLSPSEMLDLIIDTSGLRDLCLGWEWAESRLGNIEMFRAYARQYEEYCRFRNRGASFLGLYLYLANLSGGGNQSAVASPDSINVMTYHKAKGLEWPVVILGDLDKSLRDAPLSTEPRVFSTIKEFDMNNPLDGREIRYWPWPHGEMKSKSPLWEPMKNSPLDRVFAERYLHEEQRLMYVGVTRARDIIVMPVRKPKDNAAPTQPKRLEFLDACMELPFKKPAGIHDCDFNLGGKETFSTRLRYIDESTVASPQPFMGSDWFSRPAGEAPAYNEMYLAASGLEGDTGSRVISEDSIGTRIPCTFEAEEDDPSFGNAVHAFYAADSMHLPIEERISLAQRILFANGISGSISPDLLVETSSRLNNFIASRWPNGTVMKEVPIHLKRDGRVILGVADLVVETDNEIHLFDHKSFPGNQEQCRKRALGYTGQLKAYAEALEKSTGKKCATMAIHYPVPGMVVVVG